MSNLRTRIAAAMYEQRRSVSRFQWLSAWAGAHPTVQEMWLATADAVIRELDTAGYAIVNRAESQAAVARLIEEHSR